MPYTIRLSDGSVLTTIADRTIDRSTLPVALVGRGAVNYGTDFAQNFVHMLENFADVTAPDDPLVGQLWFDRTSNRLRYYAGAWNPVVPDASSLNLPNTLVSRDIYGNFSANTITANLNGNAKTADYATNAGHANFADLAAFANACAISGAWQTGRTLTLSGDVAGSVYIDGSQNVNMPVTITGATSAATANSVMKRDTNADVYASTFRGNLSGIAAAATKLVTPRTVRLTGDVVGNSTFDGTGDVTISTAVGGLTNIGSQITNTVNNTLIIGRVPTNFVRVTNNIRASVATVNSGWLTCIAPLVYQKQGANTNVLCIAEIASYNPTYGGAGATYVRLADNQFTAIDTKSLASAFLTQVGAINITDTAVFVLTGLPAGQQQFLVQIARGDNTYWTTVVNPDSADFAGGTHTYTGATSSFLFMEIIP